MRKLNPYQPLRYEKSKPLITTAFHYELLQVLLVRKGNHCYIWDFQLLKCYFGGFTIKLIRESWGQPLLEICMIKNQLL